MRIILNNSRVHEAIPVDIFGLIILFQFNLTEIERDFKTSSNWVKHGSINNILKNEFFSIKLIYFIAKMEYNKILKTIH